MKNTTILCLLLIGFLGANAVAQDDYDDDGRNDLLPGKGYNNWGIRFGFSPTSSADSLSDSAPYNEYAVTDYSSFLFEADYTYFLNSYFGLALGSGIYWRQTDTESWSYTDYLMAYNWDRVMIPFTVSTKIFPMGHGTSLEHGRNPINPFITAGAGVYMSFYGTGEYYDDWDDDWGGWVERERVDYEGDFGFHAGVGVLLDLDNTIDFSLEIRYLSLEGYPGDEYYGYNELDLGGWLVLAGIQF